MHEHIQYCDKIELNEGKNSQQNKKKESIVPKETVSQSTTKMF